MMLRYLLCTIVAQRRDRLDASSTKILSTYSAFLRLFYFRFTSRLFDLLLRAELMGVITCEGFLKANVGLKTMAELNDDVSLGIFIQAFYKIFEVENTIECFFNILYILNVYITQTSTKYLDFKAD